MSKNSAVLNNIELSTPTRTRYWVIVFAVTLAVITYIDRVCISQAAPAIMRDMGLSKIEMGYALSAFAWAYALFEIPGGWLGDWMGARKVLMRVVVWWSFFTAATGWAWNQASLVVTRALFGAGEAGCYPNLTKAFTTWLPSQERVRAQGILWMSSRWGGAFTPVLVVWIFQYLTWRRTFELFGAIGIVWAVIFYWWYRDNPKEHKGVNAAELALLRGAHENASGHGDVPWGRMISSRSVWLLWLQYACASYPWYFYITWLPTYLKESYHLEPQRAAILAGLPLFCGGIGCFVCGWLSPRLTILFGSVARSRRMMGFIACVGASAMLFTSNHLKDPVWASVAMGLASFSSDLLMPGAWGACMDVGGKYAGTLSGSMNMMGNLGGALGPVTTGYLLVAYHDWSIPFYLWSGSYLIGAVAWLFIDPVTPLEESHS
ncbi:MAG: MFS transporter [Terriglobia bacterium]